MLKHLNIKISGQVQGVFFRTSAKKEAENLNISGFVRNELNGTVYIEAEGEKNNLDKFLRWCKNGPEAAQVKNIEFTEGPVKNFKTFDRNYED